MNFSIAGTGSPARLLLPSPEALRRGFTVMLLLMALMLFAGAAVAQSITVSVSPATTTVNTGRSQAFKVTVTGGNKEVKWSVNPPIGSVSSAGVYTAPASVSGPQSVTLTATSAADPAASAKAAITVTQAVSVSVAPSGASLTASQAIQFTATVGGSSNTGVNWSVSPALGTISPTGLYTAPASVLSSQKVTVIAASAADPTKSAMAAIALSPLVTVSVAPSAATLRPGQSQQLTASVGGTATTGVIWSLNPAVGTLSNTGSTTIYTAPASLSGSQNVTITATSMANPSRNAVAVFALVQAVSLAMSPSSARLTPSGVQQFRASVTGSSNPAVNWSINPAVGTIDSSGLYTAPATILSAQAVTVTAQSAADPSQSGNARVDLALPVTVSMTPAIVAITVSESQQFTATVDGSSNTGVTWSLSPSVGTVSATGLYTAPAALANLQTINLTATSVADPSKTASSSIILTPVTVSLSPLTSTMKASQTQQFTTRVRGSSNTGINWSLIPPVGSISSGGLYTAPAAGTGVQAVTVVATSVADPAKYATASVTLSPSVSVLLSPATVSLTGSQWQQFTAAVDGTSDGALTWALSPAVGNVSPAGLYTAPASLASAQTVTLTATSVADPTKFASASILLAPPVTVSLAPGNVSLGVSQTQQFSATVSGLANTAVTWSISPAVGSVSASGLYAAPGSISSAQVVTVTATSAGDPTKSATANIFLAPPVTVSVTPGSISLGASQSQQFSANVAGTQDYSVTWFVSPAVGSVSGAGLYTAPSSVPSAQVVTLTAASVADPTKSASATISLAPAVSVSVTPSSVSLGVSGTQQFSATVAGSANAAVTWSVSPATGSVSNSGLYTAPGSIASAQVVTLTATSVADATKSASATISLAPAVTVSVTPGNVSLGASQAQQFTATVGGSPTISVAWSVNPPIGTVSNSGLYRAPSSIDGAQSVTLTATSISDPARSASATINLESSVTLSISPSSASLTASQMQQLTATVSGTSNTGVSWSLSPVVGSISTAGTTAVYNTPSVVDVFQSVEVAVTSVADPSKVAKSLITILPSVLISLAPEAVSLVDGQTQQFSVQVTNASNQAVTWSLDQPVGSISSTGLYSAPSTISAEQTINLIAQSATDPKKSATSRISLIPKTSAITYCSFLSASTPCDGSGYSVLSASLDPAGKLASGLRICKGSNCPAPTSIRLTGKRLPVRRGTISFWIKQNNNNPTSGPTEIFNTYPGDPFVAGGFVASVRLSVAAVAAGGVTTLTIPNHGLSNGSNVRVSGGTGRWSAINADWPVTTVDANAITIPLNSGALGVFAGNAFLLTPATIKVDQHGPAGSSWNYSSFKTDNFFMPPGEWHHFIWTWIADRHMIYRDGALVGTYDSLSPFPYTSTFTDFSIGTQNGGQQDITIDELATYDFAFTPEEVAAAYGSTTAVPIATQSTHGLSAFTVWGPGEQKVKVSLDAGNAYVLQTRSFHADVYRDGTVVASQAFTQLHDGFAEGLIQLPDFPSGNYTVTVVALSATGTTLATANSTAYAFTRPTWMGNSYGVDSSVPAPYWDPIATDVTGLNFKVVNRTYSLSGGFGLPVQINALGSDQLSGPVTLSLIQRGSVLPLTSPTLTRTDVKPDTAKWQGSAIAGGAVSISTSGTLEYDGMMLLRLTLKPVTGPVALDGIKLKTTLTAAAAQYVFAVKDQPFWWYLWSVRPPQAPGEFNNNLSSTPTADRTNNIFSVVFSDDDRGLQIFHNNMAGWQINESVPWQRFIREPDGSVTYECDLANHSFTLSQPLEITFGYMATPVKRLPLDWRLAGGGAYGGARAPGASVENHFDFTLGQTWSTFSLSPADLSNYYSATTLGVRQFGKKLLPFTNAHVLVPTAPVSEAEIALLKDETLSDNWNSSPSRGSADYWAWSMNRLINDPSTPNVVDGYYIDESYGYLSNPSLLTGAGYIKADGTHGIGLNLLGAREKFKRLAKVLTSAGKSPDIWMHTTAYSAPHMWSHALMTFDGERPNPGTNYYIDASSTTSPDHFDAWNDNNSLLDPTKPGRGSWLRGIAATRKFGFIPNMWRGIQCCSLPAEPVKQRRAECLYQMHDMVQQDQDLSWWQPKKNFGIANADVTFHGYWGQSEVNTSDPNVKVSYYRTGNSFLAYAANFSAVDWAGSVNLSLSVPGFTPIAKDAETGQLMNLAGGTVNLGVGSHNCRVIQVDFK